MNVQKLGIFVALALAPAMQAAAQQGDLSVGKAKAEEVCAACHGANGVSVSDNIPNLAAQRSAYIEIAAARVPGRRRRKAPNATSTIATMAAIANQLSQAGNRQRRGLLRVAARAGDGREIGAAAPQSPGPT
jgi:cytochrome c553